MSKNRNTTILILILVIAAILRFYNLMHDAPYFFNPDERNMANAISQLRLPANLSEISTCLISQFSKPPTSNLQPLTSNCNLNPRFFSYGQFPLYLSFVSDQVTRLALPSINNQQSTINNQFSTTFSSSISWLRFYSALSSTLTILIVFLISRKLFAFRFSLFAAAAAAFTPGLIQSAHFGTTESLLTFFFLLSVYISLSYLSNLSYLKFIILSSLVIGLALGSKLTGIFFFVPPAISLAIRLSGYCLPRRHDTTTQGRRPWEWQVFYWGVIGLFLVIGSILIFILSSPYNLVEPDNFKSAVFGYESDVAMGRYEAFYTRQFVNTTPIIFQAEKIFPYALGWPVFILGTIGFLLVTFNLIVNVILFISAKIQNSKFKIQNYKSKVKINPLLNFNLYFCLLTFAFLLYLIPNAFLFAKWTRFMTPILPFFAIFAGYFLFVILGSVNDSRIDLRTKLFDSGQARMTNKFVYLFICLLVITSILPGLMFMSIYAHQDSRVTASKWIYNNIPNNSYVLSETANVVDIPLGLPTNLQPQTTNNYQVISFDFYHTDENPALLFTQLLAHLQKANYIFIPSRRIFANYTQLPRKFPLITKYYQLLNSGALGFEKVVEFSSFPQLPISQIGPIRLIGNDESAEETFTVFDHPVIRIYRKVKPLTIDEYRSLFTI